MNFVGAMLVAMALDALLGWPPWLYARIGHPVTWIGTLISKLDAHCNDATTSGTRRRLAGVAAALFVITVVAVIAAVIQMTLPSGWSGVVLTGLLAWPLLAVQAMYRHVAAVAESLQSGDLAGARTAVSMIVGRDPATLDEAGVARAAIESLAENTSDGIVAPVFWGAIFGLPGIAAYKAINTLDSMIGHKTPRHQDFGWAAARIDDLANLVPARLTALLYAIASSRPCAALACAWSDAAKHRSPNAGWPESAMAGALSIRLSGPRSYHGRSSNEPWLNAGGRDPSGIDITAGLSIYVRALGVLMAGLAGLALLAPPR